MANDNIRFFTQVCNTPKAAQKSFNNGRFSGTDINPMWRIKKLTEVFGPSGIGWWTQNVKYERLHSDQTNEDMIMCSLELIYVDPESGEQSKPVYGIGGNSFVAQRKNGPQCSDEAYKMAYTDALSIACKALGFSADIYYANDKTKYSFSEEEDLTDLIGKIDATVSNLVANMSKEEKKAFAEERIIPIIGKANYKTCNEADKLKQLLKVLGA